VVVFGLYMFLRIFYFILCSFWILCPLIFKSHILCSFFFCWTLFECVSFSTWNEMMGYFLWVTFTLCITVFVCDQNTLFMNFPVLEFFFLFIGLHVLNSECLMMFVILGVEKVLIFMFLLLLFVCSDCKFSFLCLNHGSVLDFVVFFNGYVMCLFSVVPLFSLLFFRVLFSS
jgi:hypothetical protein